MEAHIEEVPTNTKRDKGFTLVELLIVIVILGVLATVTVFAVRGITDKGKTSACAADKKTLEVAVEAYIANGGDVATINEAGLVPGFLHSQVAGYNLQNVAAVADDPATAADETAPATVNIIAAPAAQNTNGCV